MNDRFIRSLGFVLMMAAVWLGNPASAGAGSGLVVSWDATNGVAYSLQRTPSLMPVTWSNVPPYTNMTGQGLMSLTNAASGASNMFYRLSAVYSNSLSLVFTETGWSQTNTESQSNIDMTNSPGQLFLKSDPSNMVPAFSVTKNIYDMVVYRDRLILSDCTSVNGTSDAYVHSYDYQSNTVSQLYSYAQGFYEQGIQDMYVWNDKLYIYGPDRADGGWDLGAIYLYNGTNWTRKLTVPGDVHGLSMGYFQNKLYLAITYSSNGTVANGLFLYQSSNDGDTWTDTGVINDFAFVKILGFNTKLAVFAYGGGSVNNGAGWLARNANYSCYVTGHEEFSNKLYIACMPGSSSSEGMLYTSDLATFTSVTCFTNAYIADVVAYDSRLYALKWSGTDLQLYGSAGGQSWTACAQHIPATGTAQVQHPVALPYHGRLYVGGVGSGNAVYVSAAVSSGSLVSKPIKMFMGHVTLAWDALTPTGTSVKFQLRTARTSGELGAKPFIGPDGTSGACYEVSGVQTCPAHNGDTWVQYKVIMGTTDAKFTPYVNRVTLSGLPFVLKIE
ncbi:MAG: hypothetical protein WCS52_18930 [bacterium]